MKKLTVIAILLTFALLATACSSGDMSSDYAPADDSAGFGTDNSTSGQQAPSSDIPAGDGAPIPAPAYPGDYSDEPSADYGYAPGEGDVRDEAESVWGEHIPQPQYDLDGESYLTIQENLATLTESEATLTFSLKVDTAAYTNIARYIDSGNLPPRDAVRTEELINYFTYESPMRFNNDSPFAIKAEVGPSPFNANRHIAFIRVKTIDIDRSELPASNLTFLIDTSGSMSPHDRLPLLKESFALLVETLTEDDIVSIVTYAGSSEILLDSVSGADKDRILRAINSLEAGGSTAGGEGIRTAYRLAERNFIQGANNRVILATDGDFNVGVSTNDELARLIGEKRGNGVYLSILGYGMGNLRDDLMETLSREGNGNYFYINDLASAEKALVDELSANLYTIADDVKAQIEFNPRNVRSYRLIGYENRGLRNEDFNNDSIDAGEVGIGTDVIMMFELELYGTAINYDSRYGTSNELPDFADELFDVRLRYKNPGESRSRLITQQVYFDDITNKGSDDFRFATAVAAFGHLLRDSGYTSDLTLRDVISLAENALGKDSAGYRMEFVRLLERYGRLI